MAESENVFSLAELGLEEEEIAPINVVDTTEEESESSSAFSLAELGLEEEEEEVIPTTSTAQTTKGLDPNKLYTVADDQQYAIDSYGEDTPSGERVTKNYDEFCKR